MASRLAVVAFAYRPWALQLLSLLKKRLGKRIRMRVYSRPSDVSEKNLRGAGVALFYGWSWFVPASITSKYRCVCLHPSLLPKYRGGSPIQNQILAGEKRGGVTLFYMDERMDAGGILASAPISLEGDLDDILARIQEKGLELSERMFRRFLRGDYSARRQDERKATSFKRRTPAQSEISLSLSARRIHDLARALNGAGYPHAFLRAGDGRKVYLLKTSLEGD